MSKKLNLTKRTPLDIWSKPSYSKSIIENIKHITDKYHKKEIELDKYRNACKDEVFDMMKQYFFSLWD